MREIDCRPMSSPCLIVACSGRAPCAWGANRLHVLEKPWQEQQWRRIASRKIEHHRTCRCRKNVWVFHAPVLKGRREVYLEVRMKGGSGGMSMAAEEGQGVSLPSNVDYISSVGNPYVKYLVRLRRSAATRQSTSSVLVIGSIPLREICESVGIDGKVERGVRMINVLVVREDADTSEGLTRFSQRVVRVSVAVMSKITGLDSPPDALGVLSYPSSFTSFERHQDKLSGQLQLEKWCSSPRRILVLDAIQDPGNLGTLIRTASAFAWVRGTITAEQAEVALSQLPSSAHWGLENTLNPRTPTLNRAIGKCEYLMSPCLRSHGIQVKDGLLLLPGCCDPFNEKALRAARGASFRIPIAAGEWHHVQELAASNGMKLYAGEPEPVRGSEETESKIRGQSNPGKSEREKGNSLSTGGIFLDYDVNIGTKLRPLVSDQESLCLVLGSEGQGLSHEIVQDCIAVSIPMPGKFESLNVAVAGGILMFLLR